MVGYLQSGTEFGQTPFQVGVDGGWGEAGEFGYFTGGPVETVDEDHGYPLALRQRRPGGG